MPAYYLSGIIEYQNFHKRLCPVDDIEIIKRIQAGDSESFSLLVQKYHRQVLAFIWRLTGDERNVEDIGQDVFLSVYKSLDRFDPDRGTPFSAWLFIAARNRCISELRKDRWSSFSISEVENLASPELSPEQTAIDDELDASIRASLEQLPEPYQSAIIESLLGNSLQEIALKHGITLGAVKSRIFRAKEKLRLLAPGVSGGKSNEEL